MLVLRGRAFVRGRIESVDLGIEDGRIVAIKKTLRGDDVVDHGDALLLPGCVDLHVHLRDPGLTEKDDFPSGTRSAALGGVTAVVDMPNTRPPVTTREELEAKRAAVAGRAAVDYGLYGAPRSGSAVPRLAGADAWKVYMAESTGGLEVDEETLAEVLRAAATTKRFVAVHAEDARAFRKPAAKGLPGHAEARPIEAEVRAIETLARLRGEARVHVAHVTSVAGLDTVPAGATVEVTAQHLLLDCRRPLRAFGKVNPPLRAPEERDALWEAFASGRADVVASDHAPHTREEKEGPFEEAPSGMPGVGAAFPLFLRRVRSQDLALGRLVSAVATRPAEILGVNKGTLEVGRDADVIAVDPREVVRLTARRLRYKCGWTAFEGLEAVFPQAVYLRGERVIEDGEAVAEGQGRPLGAAVR